MYRKILVAIDGLHPWRSMRPSSSPASKGRNCGSCTWSPRGGRFRRMCRAPTSRRLTRLRAEGKALVGAAESRARAAGVRAEGLLVEQVGHRAGDCIVRQAREWPADLIVCGTHGRRGVGRLVLGSNAEYVVHRTPVPVLLVRSAD